MASLRFAPLPHRSLIAVGGDDRKTFLQGLVSADMNQAGPDRALYGAFLTAQGRFLHDFFAVEQGDVVLLETEAARRADFVKRLSMYKLRSKVTIAPFDALSVHAVMGDGAAAAFGLEPARGTSKTLAGGVVFVDPRLAEAGLRAWLPASSSALADLGATLATAEEWDRARIALGLPDGSRDMPAEKAFLLENGFDELNGVDWKKGCYLGQELTARTKYRGLVKKRLMPVAIEGETPAFGTPLMLGEVEAGEMRSATGTVGLALIRLEAFEQLTKDGGALTAPGAKLTPTKPAWAAF